jgi:hypothetical protein
MDPTAPTRKARVVNRPRRERLIPKSSSKNLASTPKMNCTAVLAAMTAARMAAKPARHATDRVAGDVAAALPPSIKPSTLSLP